MHKLQSAQNSLTRVVLLSLRHLSASERLSYLHWLPVHYRTQFKIATLTYKTLAICQPSYLYNLLQLHQPSRAFRSSTQQLLPVPYMSTDFGRHAFSYSSPATWNSIPNSIKNCSSLYSFKRHLKSHLIAQLINTLRLATWWLARTSDSCLMCDYVRVINFSIIIIIIVIQYCSLEDSLFYAWQYQNDDIPFWD